MNKYLVATMSKGGMEWDAFVEKPQIIEAENEKEARLKYNQANKFDFFYGDVVGVIENNEIIVTNDDISKNKGQSLFKEAMEKI